MLVAGPAVAQSQLETNFGPATPALSHTSGALFFEGFESSTADATPTGWTVENTDGDDRAWIAIEQASRAHTGSFAAAVFWNSDVAADDWLFSPAISFPAAGMYELTFWFKPGDAGFGTAESMEVWIGENGPTSGDMQVQLFDIDAVPAGDDIQYTTTSETFGAGTGYLVFYCNSAADQYFCAVDDITVDAAASGPRLAVDPGGVDFGNVAVGTTAEVTVTLTNTGTSLLTISELTIVGSVFGFGDLSTYDTLLDPGESTTFGVTFTPGAEGAATT